jgi:hypothetical protein
LGRQKVSGARSTFQNSTDADAATDAVVADLRDLARG